MSRPRPRRALRPSTSVRLTRGARVVVPLALAAVGITGAVAFAAGGADSRTAVPAPSSTAPLVAIAPAAAVREQPISRDADRTSPPVSPSPSVTTSPSPTASGTPAATTPTDDELAAHPVVARSMWATDALDIRQDPAKDSDVVTEVPAGTKLSVTATVRHGFRLVLFKGKGRWVSDDYVSKSKPDPATTGGVSDAPCGKGSSMEQGLTPDAILVHRTVCARYPQVTSFGGLRGGGGFHATGQAVDCMIGDSTVGWEIARWVRAHARELGVSEVIYSQHIWTVQRGSEGWRSMSDRGSRTANHYDHVHVSVYGHRATS